jgi:hypothetical protein
MIVRIAFLADGLRGAWRETCIFQHRFNGLHISDRTAAKVRSCAPDGFLPHCLWKRLTRAAASRTSRGWVRATLRSGAVPPRPHSRGRPVGPGFHTAGCGGAGNGRLHDALSREGSRVAGRPVCPASPLGFPGDTGSLRSSVSSPVEGGLVDPCPKRAVARQQSPSIQEACPEPRDGRGRPAQHVGVRRRWRGLTGAAVPIKQG